MISEELSAWLVKQREGLRWDDQLLLLTLASEASSDEAFLVAAKGVVPALAKVGPKGHVHGWIFVGAQDTGARVFHPQHGMGTVTAHHGTHVDVAFEKSGTRHTFEAREHTAKGRLVQRGSQRSRVGQKPKKKKVGS